MVCGNMFKKTHIIFILTSPVHRLRWTIYPDALCRSEPKVELQDLSKSTYRKLDSLFLTKPSEQASSFLADTGSRTEEIGL